MYLDGLTSKMNGLEDAYLSEGGRMVEYTVTDPKTWTTTWSVEAPLPRIDPPLYEFACHEQNYGLINLVMGAQIRATDGVLDPRDPRAAR